LLKEPIEQAINLDTFRKAPIVSARQTELDPRLQGSPVTSPTATAIGKKISVSPARIEHAVRGVTGGLGEQALSLSDLAFKDRTAGELPKEGPERISRLPGVGPIARRFLGSSTDEIRRQRTEDFYDVYKKAQEARETANSYARSDRAGLKSYFAEPDKKMLYALEPTYTKVAKYLGQLRDERQRIQKSAMSQEEKKAQIRKIGRAESQTLERVNQVARRRLTVASPR